MQKNFLLLGRKTEENKAQANFCISSVINCLRLVIDWLKVSTYYVINNVSFALSSPRMVTDGSSSLKPSGTWFSIGRIHIKNGSWKLY